MGIFNFDSTFLICKGCLEAYGQHTEHHHDGRQDFAKVRICFACHEATTSMRRHKTCAEVLKATSAEVTKNFKPLIRELNRRTRLSK